MLSRFRAWLHDLPYSSRFVGNLVYRDETQDGVISRMKRAIAAPDCGSARPKTVRFVPGYPPGRTQPAPAARFRQERTNEA